MPEPSADFDLFVVGGGVNGTGIARDAAGRGFSVMLAEMGDLASGTSSSATKLVHGGLRYLEHYAFRLVAESLAEREVLWASAPHIIWPLRFVLPHHDALRSPFVLRAGLFAYDHMGGRKLLPPSRKIDLRTDAAGAPLQERYRTGFEYSDCWVDDARLVVLNARDAADRGARITTRTRLVSARRTGTIWTLETESDGERGSVTARLLVNAAGPWTDHLLADTMGGQTAAHHVRLVKGSHIVVRQKFAHDRCYLFQHGDGRIIFAIPFEDDFTLIGTTDVDFSGDPAKAAISKEETAYLCSAASEYFTVPVTEADIVWTYAGVRSLFDDGASAAKEATRDYVLTLEGSTDEARLLNVFGGKLTTFRRLAEAALAKVEAALGARGPAWTREAHLPGGDFPVRSFEAETRRLALSYPDLPTTLTRRLMRHYGTRARLLLGPSRTLSDLGQGFGADLFAQEVDYLMDHEWAQTAEDVLWRRSKLGLRVGPADVERLEAYMVGRLARPEDVR